MDLKSDTRDGPRSVVRQPPAAQATLRTVFSSISSLRCTSVPDSRRHTYQEIFNTVVMLMHFALPAIMIMPTSSTRPWPDSG